MLERVRSKARVIDLKQVLIGILECNFGKWIHLWERGVSDQAARGR